MVLDKITEFLSKVVISMYNSTIYNLLFMVSWESPFIYWEKGENNLFDDMHDTFPRDAPK